MTVRKNSRLADLIKEYYNSSNFKFLRKSTQKDYKYFLNIMLKDFSDYRFSDVTSRKAKLAYERWLDRGVPFANHVCSTSSILYNYAIDMEHTKVNPFSRVKRKTAPQRKVVWEHDHVVKFLDVAYSKWEWRNMGLIVQMAYEWVQRMGDMRTLEWDNIDLEARKCDLQQSKRRASVTLPISEDLCEMLQRQHEDFGFQKYVAPDVNPKDGIFEPYTKQKLSKLGRKIIRSAELPDNLWLMDLRRTGTTQMNEAGVSMGQIMATTGHANPQSVKPYMNHTFAASTAALETRNIYIKKG